MQKTKFQKTQQWISLIPFWSTLFIAIVTYIELYHKKAKFVYWIKYGLNLFVSAFVLALLNGVVMTGNHIILNVFASAALLVLTNCYFVQLQFEVIQEDQDKKASSITKKQIVIIIAAPIIFWMIGVTVFAGHRIIGAIKGNLDGKIEDTNGPDDFSVVTITEEELAKTDYSSYSAFFIGFSTEGSQSEVVDKNFIDVDFDKTAYSSSSLSGIYVANVTKTKSNSMSLRITSAVESGNAEIYVFVDNILYERVNINETSEIFLESISDKMIYVKVAGESAKISIDVERKIN
jgi:hypothetical protein